MRSFFGTEKRAVRALCLCAGLAIVAFGVGVGCGDDDDDEPMDPGLTDEQAFEISSGAAISTVATMQTFANGFPGVDTGGGKRAPSNPAWRAWDLARKYAATKNGGGGSRVPAIDCPGGGTADFTCDFNPTTGIATATAVSNECTATSGDTTATLDGEITFAVENALFCATQEVQPGDDATLTFDDFSAMIEIGNVATESFFADFTMGFHPTGTGCFGGANGSLTMNGTLIEESQTGATDYSLVASNLVIDISSGGAPCVATLSLDGGIAVTDLAGDRSLSESFDDLVMTVSDLPNQRIGFTLDGTLDVECIGSVTFDTVEPIIFILGAHCPAAGVLDIMLENGTDGRITYTATGGVQLDLDADGTVEASFTSCDHDDIEDCPS